MVRIFTLILIFAMLIINALLLNYLIKYITDHMVFDIDKVRYHHEQALKRVFLDGCQTGTDYPQEYKTGGYMENSPSFWCLDQRKTHVDDNMYYFLNEIGKKESWERRCN